MTVDRDMARRQGKGTSLGSSHFLLHWKVSCYRQRFDSFELCLYLTIGSTNKGKMCANKTSSNKNQGVYDSGLSK
ncbi:hypothetical protein ABKV19_010410 [Rosa sericea]